MSDKGYEKKVDYTFCDMVKDLFGNGSDYEERKRKAKSMKSPSDDEPTGLANEDQSSSGWYP